MVKIAKPRDYYAMTKSDFARLVSDVLNRNQSRCLDDDADFAAVERALVAAFVRSAHLITQQII